MDQYLSEYQKRIQIPVVTFSRIDHEDAMVATVYKANTAHGQAIIVKICDRAPDFFREAYFLRLFKDVLPVPRLIQEIFPEKNLHGAIVMECLPGELLTPQDITIDVALDIGACLAKIHMHRVSQYGDLLQEDSLSSDPQEYFTRKFTEGLAECQTHFPEDFITKCQRYYNKHRSKLDGVSGPCIVHRDFRPGNLMIYQGKFQGVIDWAGARASFLQEDFCSVEHGEWLQKPDIKKAFLKGYESIRPVPEYTSLIPFLRFNKAIATIGFTVKRGTWNNAYKKVYQYNRRFIDTLLSEEQVCVIES